MTFPPVESKIQPLPNLEGYTGQPRLCDKLCKSECGSVRISALKRKVCPFCRIVSGVFGAHFTNDTFSHSIALCFSVLFCASLNYSVNLCSFLHDIHILFVIQIICLFRARLRSSAVICSHTSVIKVLSKSLSTRNITTIYTCVPHLLSITGIPFSCSSGYLSYALNHFLLRISG